MTTFKKISLVSLAVATSLCAISVVAHETSSSEEQVSKSYDFDDFDKIAVGGVYQIDVKVGEDYSISLSGDANKMDRVNVYSEDGTLHLDTKKKKGIHIKHEGEGITVLITLPKLDAFDISGVASGEISDVDADEFSLRVSGVAEVDIEGRCGALDAKVTGVGEFDAKELKCETADVSLTGVGEMSVYASESVDVTASGVGEVNVYGNPKNVTKSKAFFSQVNIK